MADPFGTPAKRVMAPATSKVIYGSQLTEDQYNNMVQKKSARANSTAPGLGAASPADAQAIAGLPDFAAYQQQQGAGTPFGVNTTVKQRLFGMMNAMLGGSGGGTVKRPTLGGL